MLGILVFLAGAELPAVAAAAQARRVCALNRMLLQRLARSISLAPRRMSGHTKTGIAQMEPRACLHKSGLPDLWHFNSADLGQARGPVPSHLGTHFASLSDIVGTSPATTTAIQNERKPL